MNAHLVSESTGGLARYMATVALSQFPTLESELHEHPFCTSMDVLRTAREKIEPLPDTIVLSALAQPKLKRSLSSWCKRRGIAHWELVQPLVDFVSDQTGLRPIHNARGTHRCDEDYFRRIDAWEFTLQHDDSLRLNTLEQADLILLGVSRVGKTPLCAYLGSLGYRAANVSLAKEASIPKEVLDNRDKAIGLTIDAERLASVRKRRFELNRFNESLRKHSRHLRTYHSVKAALDDVMFAEQQFRKLRIPKIDVSEMTVEELAIRALDTLGLLS